MTVNEKTVEFVFSSKFAEFAPACTSIVTDQVRGKTAVSVSPVCALL